MNDNNTFAKTKRYILTKDLDNLSLMDLKTGEQTAIDEIQLLAIIGRIFVYHDGLFSDETIDEAINFIIQKH